MARNGWMKMSSASQRATGAADVAKSTRVKFGTVLGAVVALGAVFAVVQWQTAGQYPGIEDRAAAQCEAIAREMHELPATAQFVNTVVMRSADYDRARVAQSEQEATDWPENWDTVKADWLATIDERQAHEDSSGFWSIYVGGDIVLEPGGDQADAVAWECFALATHGVVSDGFMWTYDGEKAPPPD